VAVTVAEPGAMALTSPPVLTLATAGEELIHPTAVFELPVTDTESCCV
jgi:hypothetical protein